MPVKVVAQSTSSIILSLLTLGACQDGVRARAPAKQDIFSRCSPVEPSSELAALIRKKLRCYLAGLRQLPSSAPSAGNGDYQQAIREHQSYLAQHVTPALLETELKLLDAGAARSTEEPLRLNSIGVDLGGYLYAAYALHVADRQVNCLFCIRENEEAELFASMAFASQVDSDIHKRFGRSGR